MGVPTRAMIVLVTGALGLFLGSCHPVRSYLNRVEKRYEKWDTENIQVESSNGTIHARVLGQGSRTILFVHGFGPSPQVQWIGQAKAFRKEYRIVIPELPPFGRSEWNQIATYDDQVSNLIEVLDNVGAQKVTVVGLSYGGLIASLFVHAYPDRVDGLVLTDALSKFYRRSYADSLAQANGLVGPKDLLVPGNKKDLQTLINISTYRSPPVPGFLKREAIQVLYDPKRSQMDNLMNYIIGSEELASELEYNVDTPTLIVWGQGDDLIPISTGRKLAAYYGDKASLEIIPKSGHTPNLERRKKYNDILAQFFASLE